MSSSGEPNQPASAAAWQRGPMTQQIALEVRPHTRMDWRAVVLDGRGNPPVLEEMFGDKYPSGPIDTLVQRALVVGASTIFVPLGPGQRRQIAAPQWV